MDEEIKKLRECINNLQYQIDELRRLRKYDVQCIRKLEGLNDAKKDNKRRDWDILKMELKDQVLKERYGMNYKDVRFFARFKSDKEAYRLLRSTVEKYPSEVMIHNGKGSAKGIEMIVSRRV